MYNDSLFNAFARSFEARSQTDMSMAEYLESCRSDPMRYANAAERLLAAIGEPQMIDTRNDTGRWSTVGASTNIIEASWRALADSVEYGLMVAH